MMAVGDVNGDGRDEVIGRRPMTAAALLLLAAMAGADMAGAKDAPVDIGSRRELFVDRALVATLTGDARQVLHHPTPRETALTLDAPWEGSGCGYISVFRDGDGGRYRMYYKAYHLATYADKVGPRPDSYTCYAESRDGITWTKPSLGLVDYKGSKENNIVLAHGPVPGAARGVRIDAAHPAVFRDANPDAPADARYKALYLAGSPKGYGLMALKSADGFHWRALHPFPVITKSDHGFDSQNLAFWDPTAGLYRAYWRTKPKGFRDILTATSKDFVHWTEPAALTYPGAPAEQLYTNVIKPYHRAPHILIGFPVRYVERRWSDEAFAHLPDLAHRIKRKNTSERFGAALTDALLMTSRDGVTFRRWGEAFLRPGIQRPGTWAYGQQYLGWHAVETRSALPGAPNELSLYATESYWTGTSSAFRRYTLRLDGFVSIQAGAAGGELITKPITFTGSTLRLNVSTSAAGSVRVEVQTPDGRPLPGFALADCIEVFGDDVDRAVTWKGGRDLRPMAGRPVRLRLVLRDADLYALRTGASGGKR